MKYNKYNRIKNKTANKSTYWCYHCDHQLVGDHGKCSYCGKINKKYKKKGKPLDEYSGLNQFTL